MSHNCEETKCTTCTKYDNCDGRYLEHTAPALIGIILGASAIITAILVYLLH